MRTLAVSKHMTPYIEQQHITFFSFNLPITNHLRQKEHNHICEHDKVAATKSLGLA
jgi:hypothetical protein